MVGADYVSFIWISVNLVESLTPLFYLLLSFVVIVVSSCCLHLTFPSSLFVQMFHILSPLLISGNYRLISFTYQITHVHLLKFQFFLSVKTFFYHISSIHFWPRFSYFHFMQLTLWKEVLSLPF